MFPLSDMCSTRAYVPVGGMPVYVIQHPPFTDVVCEEVNLQVSQVWYKLQVSQVWISMSQDWYVPAPPLH